MSETVSILALAGSARKDSFNKRLVLQAAHGAKTAGAKVTFIDLKDYPLPIYDGDLEESEGLPENVNKLKALFKSHQGFLIASPEYNGSITALLKNTIDWVSRPVEGEPPLAAFKGKIASLMSASPGGLGGLRGLVHARAILGNIGCVVLPDQMAVGQAFKAFDDTGELVDKAQQESVFALGQQLVTWCQRQTLAVD